MAEVFEGELGGELGFVRKVAIKRLLADIADDRDAARRFLDEARIASRLHHANIVAILDVGLLDGLPFQVLELVDGLDVAAMMKRAGGMLPVEVALVIAGEVAHALGHAHDATDADGLPLGIVHRDVKPSNILVSWDCDVKLTDFGIALARDREARTEVGLVAGTLGFMSPEQRNRGVVDGASDVYALALTLHAMLTGGSPLRDFDHEVLASSGRPVPLASGLPDDIRKLISTALAPDRRERPTARRFADAIGRALVARIASDRRSTLRDFLATIRAASRPRLGALDGLLGLEVVPVDNVAQDDGPPRFELRATGATTPLLMVPADKPGIAASGTVARRRGARAIGALALAGITSVVAAFAWRRADQRADPTPMVAPVPVAPVPVADAGATVGEQTSVVAVARDVAVPIDARPAPARIPVGDRVRSSPAAPTGTGFLQAIGEQAFGARVLVDGTLRGYAPNKLEVSRGHHVIVVEKPDGTRLPPKTIDITDLDTLPHPLRIEW